MGQTPVNTSVQTVAVLFGGKSAEHEVSVRSAATVFRALQDAGYRVVPIGIDHGGKWLAMDEAAFTRVVASGAVANEGVPLAVIPGETPAVRAASSGSRAFATTIDVIFPVLHGPFGEDGCVQGMLELLDMPYVGSGVLGSALGMDKEIQKRLFQATGLPVVPYTVVRQSEGNQACEHALAWAREVGYPVFVKPANLGSSVGVGKAQNEAQLAQAVDHAFRFDRKVILEKAYRVREIECAVLGNERPQASVLGEVRPRHEFYSYEAKYLDPNGADLIVPATVSEPLASRMRDLARKVFELLECTGMARVDFFLVEPDTVFVNEINTIPGFTSISMYPRLWEASGLPLTSLVRRLVELALERHEERRRMRLRTD
ncbi:MAG: D-alanine--D-alanine ligase [candidate division KSB1 bacterium]|nr:D-alanine--D-alanine ligase [candidate division KSB1 bacterium]